MRIWNEGSPLGRADFGDWVDTPSLRTRPVPRGVFVVVAGLTGTGKTALLGELAAAGECVLDLERLACHRGSAIGGIGMLPQPSDREFRQRLVDFVASANPQRPIWIEDEGPYLGSVGVPLWLQEAAAVAPVVTLDAPVEVRVARLVRLYEGEDPAAVAAAVRSLARRIGTHLAAKAADLILAGAWTDAVATLLPFYDAAYVHRTATKQRPAIATFSGPVLPPVHEIVASQRECCTR